MTNQNDPVPGLPPQLLEYQHSSGEVHIETVDESGEATSVVRCEGQEDSVSSSPFPPLVLAHDCLTRNVLMETRSFPCLLAIMLVRDEFVGSGWGVKADLSCLC